MNRRTALLAGAAMLATSRASAHWIKDKHGRVYSVASHTDRMCTHNRAHERGLKHDDNGHWYNAKTGRRDTEARESTSPEHEPTPQIVVDAILAAIKPTPEDVLLDPGCGDGRFLIAAARDYHCRAIGIEIDRPTALNARSVVSDAGQTDRVVILPGDARRDPLLSVATLVVMYLYPDLMAELWPKLRNARAVASYQHELPVYPQTKYTLRKEVFYVWNQSGKKN